ncbi:MAG: TetR family transcriptional regulator [Aeromicrobium sp.]|uniref:TetR/AcrR family transcriptional regulator n=1 Tax=Aeromicrobium sp. TaxID=1871063 RepID=UPI0039E22511
MVDEDSSPRRRDPEATRRTIVVAAAEIVSEQGVAALTHRAAAARGEVSLGSTTRHFPSIDALREAALGHLADEIDTDLDEVETALAGADDLAERGAAIMRAWLLDTRQVRSTMALVSAATTDSDLRALSARWTDRLTAILARHVGRERAVAIDSYLNGVTMHAALNDHPLDEESIARVIRALVAMPTAESE